MKSQVGQELSSLSDFLPIAIRNRLELGNFLSVYIETELLKAGVAHVSRRVDHQILVLQNHPLRRFFPTAVACDSPEVSFDDFPRELDIVVCLVSDRQFVEDYEMLADALVDEDVRLSETSGDVGESRRSKLLIFWRTRILLGGDRKSVHRSEAVTLGCPVFDDSEARDESTWGRLFLLRRIFWQILVNVERVMEKEHVGRVLVLGHVLDRRSLLAKILGEREIGWARERVPKIGHGVIASQLDTIGDFEQTSETNLMVLELSGVSQVDRDRYDEVFLKTRKCVWRETIGTHIGNADHWWPKDFWFIRRVFQFADQILN